ncbi:MAG: PIN domain-containing protein [Candidatus Tectomicrobia bacterium]|uniref:PIN domain-containing protein n=1 Tax=Tectimicrobiota bacterium TaxID=2528274 RepID=A0A933LQ58_UNCTE|nr:PIN domain-containing protein [Candidatus Tectomicrobia bacterium]
MNPPNRVALDTSVLVGLVDSRDIWHPVSVTLRDALKGVQAQIVYFDCVIGEAINVLARRAKERKRSSEFTELLTQVVSQVTEESIIWISRETKRFYPEMISLVRDSIGALNFNDTLLALGCRELAVEFIATVDSDFDSVAWLKRLSSPNDITSPSTPSR